MKLSDIYNPFKQIAQPKSVNQLVEEIHESFFTEVDNLLADAKIAKSLDTDKKDLIEKCNRLKSLGFVNTREVKEATDELNRLQRLEKENEAKQSLIAAINYFSFKYPNYKFITEDSVKRICQKYGLVYGEISRYLGTVPDKNLVQMEQFKIDEDDELYLFTSTIERFGGRRTMMRSSWETREMYNKYNETRVEQYNYPSEIREICQLAPLEIAAPLKDFNMKGLEVNDFKISKIEIPDPVVLKPVIFNRQKFYLIVTAWGIEASDSEVVNEKLN